MKDWLVRWCGCHVVLFLSYLQKDKGELVHVGRAKELDKRRIAVCLRGPSFHLSPPNRSRISPDSDRPFRFGIEQPDTHLRLRCKGPFALEVSLLDWGHFLF